jgi:hypothetical protein
MHETQLALSGYVPTFHPAGRVQSAKADGEFSLEENHQECRRHPIRGFSIDSLCPHGFQQQ